MLELYFKLNFPDVIRDKVGDVLWFHCWVKANHFKVIMVKSYQVSTPTTFIYLNHTITLILNFVLSDNFIAMAQQLRDLAFSLLGAEAEVLDIWVILYHKVKVINVTLLELINVLDTHSNDTEGFF